MLQLRNDDISASHVTGSACLQSERMSSAHPSSARRRAEPTKIPAQHSITEDSEDDTEPETEPAIPNTDVSALSLEEMIQLQSTAGRKSLHRSRPEPARRKEAELGKAGPAEISSKQPVPFLRKVLPAKKTMRRDPRFDDLSGEYKPEVFASTYRFLEGIKKKEREIVQKKLRKARNPDMKDKLQQLIHRMDQQEKAEEKRLKQREKDLEYKRRLREDARQGKRPFYLKKGEVRRLELADKYQDLKHKGKLETFLSKKRKRNSHKDRRRLPNQ